MANSPGARPRSAPREVERLLDGAPAGRALGLVCRDARAHLVVARLGRRDHRDGRRRPPRRAAARSSTCRCARPPVTNVSVTSAPAPHARARRARRDDGDVALAVVDEPDARVVVLGDRVGAQHRGGRAQRGDVPASRQQEQAVGELAGQREVVERVDPRSGPSRGGARRRSRGPRPGAPRSSALVGSSMSSTGASCASAVASTTRWRSPPESVARCPLSPAAPARGARGSPAAVGHVVGRPLDRRDTRDVRCPTQQHVVEHRHVRSAARATGARRTPARCLCRSHGCRGPAASPEVALALDEAGDGAQVERRLARAVCADHPRATPRARPSARGRGRPRRRRARRSRARSSTAVMTSTARHTIPRAERSTTAKNGAPRNAVMTPIGSSAGDSIVRASEVGRRPGTPRRARARAAAARACCPVEDERARSAGR